MSVSSVNKDQEHFNQWAETYEQSFTQWLLFDRVHRAALKSLPSGFTPTGILDIGCGTGRLLRRMHARWPQAFLVGIDLAEGMVVPNIDMDWVATTATSQVPLIPASIDGLSRLTISLEKIV